MKIFDNLKNRLLFSLFTITAFIFSIFGYLFFIEVQKNYEKSTENLLTTVIKDLRYEYIFEINNAFEFEDVKNEFEIDELFVQIVKSQNGTYSILSKSKDLKNLQLPVANIDVKNLKYRKIYFSNERIGDFNIKMANSLIFHDKDSNIILQCAVKKEGTTVLQTFKQNLIVSFLILVILILAIVNYIISKTLNQTRQVSQEVKSIKIDGNLHSINKTKIAPQIDEMIETFNFLINELQTSFQKMQEFGHNASHELKTPLTIIKNEVDIGLLNNISDEEYRQILQNISIEIDNLNEIINALLFLSSSQKDHINEKFEPIYIDELLEEVLDKNRSFAQTKNIKYTILSFEPVTQSGDAELLKIALSNIVDNAIKYSNQNSHIEIELSKQFVCIRDFGIGMDANEITKIFDKFYRIKPNQHTAKGFGLGLAITKNILQLHNFEIKITSELNKGTEFKILFH